MTLLSARVATVITSLLFLNTTAHSQNKYKLNFTDNPPFSMMNGDTASGVAVKVVEEAFEKAHLNYAFQLEPLARAMYDAKTKEYNCAFPVQRSQRNEADYKWVSPIYIASSGLYANPDSNIRVTTLADAKPLRLGALRGSGDAEYLKGFGYYVDEANSQDQNIKKLQSKKIDLWATDVLSASYFGKQVGANAPKLVFVFRKSLGSLACNTKTPDDDIEALQAVFDAMIKIGHIKAEALDHPAAN